MFSGIFKRKNKKSEIIGNQEGLSYLDLRSTFRRNLEILDKPIREPGLARDLLEMQAYCWEVFHTLEAICQDTFLSTDGDDQGFTISNTQNDGETLINPDIKVIALDLFQRTFDDDQYVIGGDCLSLALEECLAYGDSFMELGFEKDGKNFLITRSLYLPSWEMFRIEDEKGFLKQFEQRQQINQEEGIIFEPNKIIHFRHRRKRLYGRSLFLPSRVEWYNLKNAVENCAIALQEGNPTIHKISSGMNEEKIENYKFKYKKAKDDEAILTDLFISSSIELQKLMADYPNLSSYFEAILYHRKKMIPAGMPSYYYGIDIKGGSKELAREPARRYARMRNSWCALLTKGIKRALNIELINIKGMEWFQTNARNKYRIIWPKWIVDADLLDTSDESNDNSVQNLEDNNEENADNEERLR